MHAEIKALWIEALEADDAPPQGHRYLGLPTGERCCLGVLCDIAVEQGVIPPPTTVEGSGEVVLRYGIRTPDYNDTTIHALPIAVMKWAGLDSVNPDVHITYVKGVGGIATLAEYNDNGYDFGEIVTLIQEDLDTL